MLSRHLQLAAPAQREKPKEGLGNPASKGNITKENKIVALEKKPSDHPTPLRVQFCRKK